MLPSHAELLRSVDPGTLGTRLRDARVSRGLTQTEVASDDISVGYVSRIESGTRRPQLPVLTALAGRLGVSVDYLLVGVTAAQYDEIRLGLDYAQLALESGEVVEARQQATEQLARAEAAALTDLTERARLLLGRSLEAGGDLDTAISELETLAATATGLLAGECGIALCRCYREAGDLALAIESGERIRAALADSGLGLTDEAVQLTVSVAAAYIERGDLHRAARICNDAVQTAEELGSTRARSSAYWEASIVQTKRGDIRAALTLAARALALLSEGQDARNLARLRVQLGDLRLQLHPPAIEEAFRELNRAREELLSTSASEIDRARTDVVLAQAHLLAGDPERALTSVTSAQELAGDRAAQLNAEALVVRGQALAALGRAAEARASFRNAVHVLTGAGADRSAAQPRFELAELMEGIGDDDAAREAYRSAAASSGLVSRRRDLSHTAAVVTRSGVSAAGRGR